MARAASWTDARSSPPSFRRETAWWLRRCCRTRGASTTAPRRLPASAGSGAAERPESSAHPSAGQLPNPRADSTRHHGRAALRRCARIRPRVRYRFAGDALRTRTALLSRIVVDSLCKPIRLQENIGKLQRQSLEISVFHGGYKIYSVFIPFARTSGHDLLDHSNWALGLRAEYTGTYTVGC